MVNDCGAPWGLMPNYIEKLTHFIGTSRTKQHHTQFTHSFIHRPLDATSIESEYVHGNLANTRLMELSTMKFMSYPSMKLN